MEVVLSITHSCSGEGGNILVQRKDGQATKEMGTIKFEDAAQKRWLLMVLMEMHPYVSLVDPAAPCDPLIGKEKFPC
jgi:hypothetical protein